MKNNRSTLLVAMGAAVFVIGAGLSFLAIRSGGDEAEARPVEAVTPTTLPPGQVTVPGTAETFVIPPGKQAIAVQVPYVAGLAGYAKAGDVVNVFAVIKDHAPKPAITKLVLQKVPVLAVNSPVVGAGAGATTFLLGVTAGEAEQLAYFQAFETVHLTLVPSDQSLATTVGRTLANLY